MRKPMAIPLEPVHCRTGSLEKVGPGELIHPWVHCRTGSLEMILPHFMKAQRVHCRTGSLEMLVCPVVLAI